MRQPKIGLITFGDHREHEWQHVFEAMTVPRHRAARDFLATLPVELTAAEEVARTRPEINTQVDQLKVASVELLVAHIPCWTSPNLVIHGIQRLGIPTVLLGNQHPGTHSTVGLLGAGGGLSQIGYSHLRVRADFGEQLAAQLLCYARAAAVPARLRGRVFGLFGGRSLGIDTGSFDPLQWKKLFGIDTEHIDQLEIIRRADLVSEEAVTQMLGWLSASVGRVAYNGRSFTPEKLAYQVRCYLATLEIIREMGLDFVAIKCMPDLTTHFVPQCISAALLPSPYDAAGPREPLMMACEADGDAALTMEILKEISGGKPVLFMDVSYIDAEQNFYLPNCGALCSWYAKRSADPAENMRQIELRPANRPGGGAITYFTTAPGPLTFARLFRVDGAYRMAIIEGETIEISEEDYATFVTARGSHQLPTAFARLNVDSEQLIREFGSNHILAVDGHYTAELSHLCGMLGIEVVTFSPNLANIAHSH